MKNKQYYRYYTYISPLIKSPFVKSYGTPIFTLLALTIFVIFAIRPTLSTITVLQKKLTDTNQLLEKVNLKSENLAKGRSNYQALSSEVKNKIQLAIPQKAEFKTLIGTLEDTALTHQASISALQIQSVEVKPENSSGESKLLEIKFTFNIEGGYNNLLLFLEKIKQGIRLIEIEQLAINRSSESNIIIMSIRGKAYYLE